MKTNEELRVLDKGFVALDSYCADDLSVVNAARVSFNKRVDVLSDGDEKLVGFLMKGRHMSPFEHNFFRFRIKAPIFVFREWHRHRIGISINEQSGRYSQLENEFYIPDEQDMRSQVGRPGHYTFEKLDCNKAENYIEDLTQHCEKSFKLYEEAIKNGVAKEQARMLLPVNLYSTMYWSYNARSLMSFLSLRNTEFAQMEIREYAKVMESIFSEVMPITAKYFIENGRKV